MISVVEVILVSVMIVLFAGVEEVYCCVGWKTFGAILVSMTIMVDSG